MALPTAAPAPKLQHRRSIDVQIYACGNGLWEVGAEIRDTKTRDARHDGRHRNADEPIHNMLVRLVVDEHFSGREFYPRWYQARAVTPSET